jgi:cytochrome c553
VAEQQKKMAAKADDPSKVWTLTDLVKRGESVYAANCVACHQANGKGAGPIKPLDGSAIVLDADKSKMINDHAQRRSGGAMPAWKQLSDTELAAVMTYAKNSWSNKTSRWCSPPKCWPRASEPHTATPIENQRKSTMSAVLDHHDAHTRPRPPRPHGLASLGVRHQPQGHRHPVPAVQRLPC